MIITMLLTLLLSLADPPVPCIETPPCIDRPCAEIISPCDEVDAAG